MDHRRACFSPVRALDACQSSSPNDVLIPSSRTGSLAHSCRVYSWLAKKSSPQAYRFSTLAEHAFHARSNAGAALQRTAPRCSAPEESTGQRRWIMTNKPARADCEHDERSSPSSSADGFIVPALHEGDSSIHRPCLLIMRLKFEPRSPVSPSSATTTGGGPTGPLPPSPRRDKNASSCARIEPPRELLLRFLYRNDGGD